MSDPRQNREPAFTGEEPRMVGSQDGLPFEELADVSQAVSTRFLPKINERAPRWAELERRDGG